MTKNNKFKRILWAGKDKDSGCIAFNWMYNSKKEELKACPFCGSEPFIFTSPRLKGNATCSNNKCFLNTNCDITIFEWNTRTAQRRSDNE